MSLSRSTFIVFPSVGSSLRSSTKRWTASSARIIPAAMRTASSCRSRTRMAMFFCTMTSASRPRLGLDRVVRLPDGLLDELAAEVPLGPGAHAILERHDVVAERAQREDGEARGLPRDADEDDLLVLGELLEVLLLEELVDGDPDRPGDLPALLAGAGGRGDTDVDDEEIRLFLGDHLGEVG